MINIFKISLLQFLPIFFTSFSFGKALSDSIITIKRTRDFQFKNEEISNNWDKTKWINLIQLKGNENETYFTKAKILYSSNGIYFLFLCGDKIINSTFHSDLKKLWTQDVVEVFLFPDLDGSSYFEYELSPLNYELPLLITSGKDKIPSKWVPYADSEVRIRHKVLIIKKNNNQIKKWLAKIFIPFKFLEPLNNIYPKKGSKWKANFYRIDYDSNNIKWWAWQPVNKGFHERNKFGTFIFGK